jgi:ATP-dependent DNA helicase DinG
MSLSHDSLRGAGSPAYRSKVELIEERGGDPFTEFSLPEAVLKLRQGVGRLIRTKGDHGIIVILDNRIVTKPYGRAFRRRCRNAH